MAEQEQNRSEQATPYKLQKAREKGNVVKSTEIHSLFIVAAFLIFLNLWGSAAARQLAVGAAALLGQAHALAFGPEEVAHWGTASLLLAVFAIAPLLGVLVLSAVASSVLQFGVVFTAQPLKPDWQRINPIAGFKRLFSRRALFDTLKNVLKLVLFAAVLYLTVRSLMQPLLGLLYADSRGYGAYLLQVSSTVVLRLLLALLAVAAIDFVFTNREYSRKLMMSRREIKDEMKHREGDPKIKARIRELQNEMRQKSRSMKQVGGADVLITNPTHLAVALSYRHGEMDAPQIVAKGAGDMVEHMKAVARRHGVTIVENRPLARALYKQPLHASVPPDQYAQVARILIWVQESRRLRAAARSNAT